MLRLRNHLLILGFAYLMQENIPLEEVFDHLESTIKGLDSDEVQKRLDLFGYNKLEEKKVS